MKYLKEWGGWITWLITLVIGAAVFISTQKNQAEDIQDIKQIQHEIRDFMDEQLKLNGQIIQYMVMDSE